MINPIKVPISPYQLGRYELVKAMYVPEEKAFILLFKEPHDVDMPFIRGYVTRNDSKVMVMNNSSTYQFFLGQYMEQTFKMTVSSIAGSMFIRLRTANAIKSDVYYSRV